MGRIEGRIVASAEGFAPSSKEWQQCADGQIGSREADCSQRQQMADFTRTRRSAFHWYRSATPDLRPTADFVGEQTTQSGRSLAGLPDVREVPETPGGRRVDWLGL
jgi:hypothetical protein